MAMNELKTFKQLCAQAAARPYRIAGYSGEHEEAGACIRGGNRDAIVFTTTYCRNNNSEEALAEYTATPTYIVLAANRFADAMALIEWLSRALAAPPKIRTRAKNLVAAVEKEAGAR
jgi:hypothetical protein